MFNVLSEIKNFSATKLKKVQTRVVTSDGRELVEHRDRYGGIVTKETGKIGPNFVRDTKPDLQIAEILPGLCLGSQDPAQDVALLKQNNITHILNVASGVDNTLGDQFVCKKVEILDLPETNIRGAFEPCFAFIHNARNQKGKVLIHCNAGISRSATVLLAYLMKHEGMRLDQAMDAVKAKRDIKPNEGFLRQLKAFDEELAQARSTVNKPAPLQKPKTVVTTLAIGVVGPPPQGRPGPPPPGKVVNAPPPPAPEEEDDSDEYTEEEITDEESG